MDDLRQVEQHCYATNRVYVVIGDVVTIFAVARRIFVIELTKAIRKQYIAKGGARCTLHAM